MGPHVPESLVDHTKGIRLPAVQDAQAGISGLTRKKPLNVTVTVTSLERLRDRTPGYRPTPTHRPSKGPQPSLQSSTTELRLVALNLLCEPCPLETSINGVHLYSTFVPSLKAQRHSHSLRPIQTHIHKVVVAPLLNTGTNLPPEAIWGSVSCLRTL